MTCATYLVAAPPRVTTATGIRSPPLLEAGRAVDRLVGARLERHAGNVAAAGAHGLIHLPRCTGCTALVATAGGVRTAIALGASRCAAIWAARWFAESAAGIKVLLAGGKGETLATVAAGQCHVARHLVDGSLRTNKNVRSAQLARARSPVGWVWVPSTRGFFTDEEQCQPPQFSGSLRPRASACLGKKRLGVTTYAKRGRPLQRRPLAFDFLI